jgi:hypothetical protein
MTPVKRRSRHGGARARSVPSRETQPLDAPLIAELGCLQDVVEFLRPSLSLPAFISASARSSFHLSVIDFYAQSTEWHRLMRRSGRWFPLQYYPTAVEGSIVSTFQGLDARAPSIDGPPMPPDRWDSAFPGPPVRLEGATGDAGVARVDRGNTQ